MKKIIFILILIFVLILGGIGYYVYINNGNQSVNPGEIFKNVKNFFPFGTPSVQVEQNATNTSSGTIRNQTEQPKQQDRMFKISEAPVSGFVTKDITSTSTELFFNKEKNATTSTTTKQTETFIEFIERATGHIFEYKLSNQEKNRISNTTIPKVYNAYLNSKGTEFITQTLSDENINTEYRKIMFATTTGTSTDTQKLNTLSKSVFYPYNTDIIIAKGDFVFYTTKTANGSIGYISGFENKKPIQIFSTPLREIGAIWSGGDIVEIFNKPHSEYEGISFSVDIKKKTIKQTITGINGLTASPNTDGTYILYNSNIGNLSLSSKKLSSNTDNFLNLKTLPEKCVWSKKNTKIIYCAVPVFVENTGYPEKWYQGIVSFNDEFWSINVETGDKYLVYSPKNDKKDSPDATNLTLNNKENYLFFTNKKDLSLWGVSL